MVFDENSYRENVYELYPDKISVPGDFSSTLVVSITVPVYARYLILRGILWTYNSNGIRITSVLPTGGGRQESVTQDAISSGGLNQQLTTIAVCKVNQAIQCYGAQNSGVNIDVYPYMHIILLKRL